jgi:ATP-binding cassette subfamily B protein
MRAKFRFIPGFRKSRQAASARDHSTAAGGNSLSDLETEPDYKPIDRKVLRGVLAWMRPYRSAYILTTVVGTAVNVLEMITPRYMQQLVDVDIPGKHQNIFTAHIIDMIAWFNAGAADSLAHLGRRDLAYFNIGSTIAVWALTMAAALLLQRFGIYYTTLIGQKVIFTLRRRVFAHLQELSMNFYDKTRFGRILTRGTSDIDSMSNFIVWGINTAFSNVTMMVIAAAIIMLMDWRIGLAVLWLGPVLYIMNNLYRRKVGVAWRMTREGYTRVSTNLAENISGMRVVTAFNRQNQNLDVFNDLQTTNTANNMRAACINGIYQPLLGVVGFLGKVIILVFGTWLVFHTADDPAGRRFKVGELVALYVYWDWFMGPVINFGNFYNDTMMAMACAERVQNLLAEKPQVTDAPDAIMLPEIRGSVCFEHVTFGYDPAKPVLRDIHFQAQPGQTVALVGHTGCGKSTVISLICRFYQPQQGRILIDGYDLRKINGESLHRQTGIVSQNNFLFTGTVMDNIRYTRPEATDQQVFDAARQLDCYDILARLKDGFQTHVGERGGALSLGQRQLVCFCRAFLANPRILILDEATSAIDTQTELLIQKALERLVENRTTFIVAHRLSTIVGAHQVLVLDHGQIVEQGNHHTLLERRGQYARLYNEFTQGHDHPPPTQQ